MNTQRIEEQLAICDALRKALDFRAEEVGLESARALSRALDAFNAAARDGYPEALRELKAVQDWLLDTLAGRPAG